jgi:hypothetical protein
MSGGRWKRIVTGILGAAFAASSGGCSFIFVDAPNAVISPHDPPRYNTQCTENPAAPTLDIVLALLQAARTGYAFTRSESDYRGKLLSRKADIGFGLSLTTLFTVSGIYGASSVSECSRAKRWVPADDDEPRSRPRLRPQDFTPPPMPPPLPPRTRVPSEPAAPSDGGALDGGALDGGAPESGSSPS